MAYLIRDPAQCYFDDVSRSSLYGRIDLRDLCHAAPHAVARIDFGMLPDAAKQRFRDSGVSRPAQTVLDVTLHPLVLFEVLRNEFGRFVRADAELLGESVGSLSVNNPEIDGFRALALHCGDLIDR